MIRPPAIVSHTLKNLLAGAIVITIALVAFGLAVLIETFRPAMSHPFGCAILIAAALAIGAIALRFMP